MVPLVGDLTLKCDIMRGIMAHEAFYQKVRDRETILIGKC